MQVRLDVCVSAIARDAGLDPDRNATDRLNIIGWLNDTRREIYELPNQLSALEFTGEIVGTTVVTAGTVNATNGQAEVTGSSTAFASAMNGRYMSIDGSAWQRVSYVTDTTHLTLESGWQGETKTSATYKIWKRFYALPAKAAKVNRVFDYSASRQPLAYYDPQEFYSRFGFGDTFGEAEAYTQLNTTDLADDFLGSTVYVSVTTVANSPIVDFTSASLIANLFPGDRIKLGNSTTSTAFVVDKVLTDNKIALNSFVSTSSSTMTATAMGGERLLVAFYPTIDNNKVYAIEGVKQLSELSNNQDLLEKGWYSAILKGAVAKAFGYVRDPREDMKKGEYGQELIKLVRNQYKAKNPTNRLKPYIGRRYGNSGLPVEDKDTY